MMWTSVLGGGALGDFVHIHDDVSDQGGYKFRFHCDLCQRGFDSSPVPASNPLSTPLMVNRLAQPLGPGIRSYAESVDPVEGTPERDAAFRKASAEVKEHFHKCKQCGKWVCEETCWNLGTDMCSHCAPEGGWLLLTALILFVIFIRVFAHLLK